MHRGSQVIGSKQCTITQIGCGLITSPSMCPWPERIGMCDCAIAAGTAHISRAPSIISSRQAKYLSTREYVISMADSPRDSVWMARNTNGRHRTAQNPVVLSWLWASNLRAYVPHATHVYSVLPVMSAHTYDVCAQYAQYTRTFLEILKHPLHCLRHCTLRRSTTPHQAHT